jgi:hypothetical protein
MPAIVARCRKSGPFSVGQVLEISFPTFTPRIAIRSERELTVEIVAGDNNGFSDTVQYEAVTVRDGLVVLSWREQIGSTIVHVLDLISGQAYTAITPAKVDSCDWQVGSKLRPQRKQSVLPQTLGDGSHLHNDCQTPLWHLQL